MDLYSVSLHFAESLTPTYGTSFQTQNIILKAFADDGLAGIGEASPSPVTKESDKTITSSLDKLVPTLRNSDELAISSAIQEMDGVIARNPSAKAAIDIALHDILEKRTKPIFALYGERRGLQTDLTLSSGTLPKWLKTATKRLQRVSENRK